MGERNPFVSCIMATRDRPAFFRRAVRYFLLQTYRTSELVVVDDGSRAVGSCCVDSRVRYIRLTEPTVLGAKLNIGIAAARGDVLIKMDDDDYYNRKFVATMVGGLEESHNELGVAALDSYLVFIAGDGVVRVCPGGCAVGASLSFSRAVWGRRPFRDLPKHVDYWFKVDNCGVDAPTKGTTNKFLIPVHGPEMFVAIRHGHNTWTTSPDGQDVDTQLRWLPHYWKPIENLMDPADARFYRALPSARPYARHECAECCNIG